jgi:cytochrome c553
VLLSLACIADAARAQDAVRGAQLYRELPGSPGVGSCISCHGEPINNRNSVLRGAAGPELISRTIAAVGPMGFLRQYLSEADLADVSAYLGTIVPAGALETLPDPWPTVDDFGAQAVGTQAPERHIWVRNLQPRSDIALGTVVSSDPVAFPVQHECPLSLPPLAQCRIRSWFRPQAAGQAEARIDIQGSSGQVLRGVRLLGNGVALQPVQLAWSDAALVDFGRVAVGGSASVTVQLINASAQPVPLRRLRVTGPQALRYTLTAPCAAAGRLVGGERCDVTITHAPRAAERSEGWVELDADAGNAPLLRVQAIGVPAAVEEPPSQPPPQASGTGGGTFAWLWTLWLAFAALVLRRSRRTR